MPILRPLPPRQPQAPRDDSRNPDDSLLGVRDLSVVFPSPTGQLHAADGITFTVQPGEILGVVGESGSGKSVTMSTLLGLTRTSAQAITGTAMFAGRDLIAMAERDLREIRGRDIGMVFQDPMTSFNPVRTMGRQLADALLIHQPHLGKQAARQKVIEALDSVGIPAPARRLDQYPHEFSGGMRQRAMIAMAMINGPRLLIADEATTALDVTIQAQILDLMLSVRDTTGAAIILITHDLGLLAEIADRVIVMYAGRLVESGNVHNIFDRPRHPYTAQLRCCRPALDRRLDRLPAIPGQPPMLSALPGGCSFHPRCDMADPARCQSLVPPLLPVGTDHLAACHLAQDMATAVEPQRVAP